MKMEAVHYLPHEELKGSNYPEVVSMSADIDAIQNFAKKVDQAVLAYNENVVDKVDLDVMEVQSFVNQCRKVCDVLGNAPNVCYDILLEIRALQMNFQELVFISNRFGSEYIGKPTPINEEGGTF